MLFLFFSILSEWGGLVLKSMENSINFLFFIFDAFPKDIEVIPKVPLPKVEVKQEGESELLSDHQDNYVEGSKRDVGSPPPAWQGPKRLKNEKVEGIFMGKQLQEGRSEKKQGKTKALPSPERSSPPRSSSSKRSRIQSSSRTSPRRSSSRRSRSQTSSSRRSIDQCQSPRRSSSRRSPSWMSSARRLTDWYQTSRRSRSRTSSSRRSTERYQSPRRSRGRSRSPRKRRTPSPPEIYRVRHSRDYKLHNKGFSTCDAANCSSIGDDKTFENWLNKNLLPDNFSTYSLGDQKWLKVSRAAMKINKLLRGYQHCDAIPNGKSIENAFNARLKNLDRAERMKEGVRFAKKELLRYFNDVEKSCPGFKIDVSVSFGSSNENRT